MYKESLGEVEQQIGSVDKEGMEAALNELDILMQKLDKQSASATPLAPLAQELMVIEDRIEALQRQNKLLHNKESMVVQSLDDLLALAEEEVDSGATCLEMATDRVMSRKSTCTANMATLRQLESMVLAAEEEEQHRPQSVPTALHMLQGALSIAEQLSDPIVELHQSLERMEARMDCGQVCKEDILDLERQMAHAEGSLATSAAKADSALMATACAKVESASSKLGIVEQAMGDAAAQQRQWRRQEFGEARGLVEARLREHMKQAEVTRCKLRAVDQLPVHLQRLWAVSVSTRHNQRGATKAKWTVAEWEAERAAAFE